MLNRLATLLCLCLCLSWGSRVASEPVVQYLFFEIRPIMYLDQGQPRGRVAERVVEIFRLAGVDYQIKPNLPYLRVLSLLREDIANRCSAGWFKTAERAASLQYSLPFYQDQPLFILGRASQSERLRLHDTLVSLLSDRDLALGTINGLSYGQTMDNLIAQYRPNQHVVQSYPQLFHMFLSGRIDYIIADEFDLPNLTSASRQADYVTLSFPDLPPGEARYIICSNRTPADTMDALNSAIATLNVQRK